MSGEELSPDFSILELAAERFIQDVLHFTTNHGLIGILGSGGVKARADLETDQYVEHVYQGNCADRLKDQAWTGYVNLSVTRVNANMLLSSQRWPHNSNAWWAVLAFEPSILTHPGVWFTTTNNVYPVCRRNQGAQGFASLFADSVDWGYFGSARTRQTDMPSNYTTDPQAEVLYPKMVPLSYLKAIYVMDGTHVDQVHSYLAALNIRNGVAVEVKPEVFQ